jgi:alkaline phosphatase
MKKLVSLLLMVVILLPSALSCRAEEKDEKTSTGASPRNVIVLIGDGMGVSQLTLALYVGPGQDGKLAVDSMPVVGLARTHSANCFVTDSAAAGTALATGAKTNNKMLSVTPDGQPIETALEVAKKHGKAAGLVTTTTITHATPASFGAHVDSRGDDAAIAKQYVAGAIEVLLGGAGKAGKDIESALLQAGWKGAHNRDELNALDAEKIIGFFTPGHMSYEIDRARTNEPSLAEMTSAALKTLSKNPKGLFLMVEGGRIDHACHGFDACAAAFEILAFNEAVRTCLNFAAKDGQTLVVVTADHATGGMDVTERLCPDRFYKVKASAEYMAELAGREKKKFSEVVESLTDMKFTAEEYEEIEKAPGKWGRQNMLGRLISERLGVCFMPMSYYYSLTRTDGHDGGMVSVHAFGPGAERFGGMQDNTNVGKQLKALLASAK